jgi:hypothetical protein
VQNYVTLSGGKTKIGGESGFFDEEGENVDGIGATNPPFAIQ